MITLNYIYYTKDYGLFKHIGQTIGLPLINPLNERAFVLNLLDLRRKVNGNYLRKLCRNGVTTHRVCP